MKSANELRTLVCDNALTLGRLTADQLGSKKDYDTLSALYRDALDALTVWASKDYRHKSEKGDADASFTAIKAILELYATDETRIVIDQASMRTMRDCATKPKRLYSAEYKAAEKARKAQQKTVDARYTDILTLGAPKQNEDEDTEDYIARLKALDLNFVVGTVDMRELFVNATAVLAVKTKAVEDIKAAGNWTWRRPVAVSLIEFADLIENYIADCLIDGYNIKSSVAIREERKAAAEARALEAKAAK